MKYSYLLFFTFFFSNVFSNVFSQDIIVKIDGEIIRSKVVKISPDNIEYNKFDNLDGPIYVLPITEIQKIDFKNGTVENFNVESKSEEVSIEDLKQIIIENINNNAFQRDGDKAYTGDFEGKYLKLSRRNIESGEVYGNYRLYDFSSNCIFHSLSKRGNGTSYINIFVPRVIDGENRGGYKLVILVEGHNNGQLLLDALKKYNDFFKED